MINKKKTHENQDDVSKLQLQLQLGIKSTNTKVENCKQTPKHLHRKRKAK